MNFKHQPNGFTSHGPKLLDFLNRAEIAHPGINLSQLKVLLRVAQGDEPKVHELGEATGLSRSSCSRVVREMAHKGSGLLQLVLDDSDERMKRVRLTQRGRKSLEAAMDALE